MFGDLKKTRRVSALIQMMVFSMPQAPRSSEDLVLGNGYLLQTMMAERLWVWELAESKSSGFPRIEMKTVEMRIEWVNLTLLICERDPH